jgi:hypothetical protein
VIALAGDTILIADNGYVMIHNPASLVWGEAKDMLKAAELLNKVADGIAGDYARHMGITVDAARALMDAETWWLGMEAVDAGYAQATYTGVRAAAAFDLGRVSAKAPEAALARFGVGKSDSVRCGGNKESKMKMTKEEMAAAAAKATAESTVAPTDAPAAPDTPAAAPAAPAEAAATPCEATAVVDVKAAVAAALADERKRTAAITALSEKFGFQDAGRAAIEAGVAVDAFRAQILDKSPDEWRASLAIKNPSVQATATPAANPEAEEAVRRVKALRDARK